MKKTATLIISVICALALALPAFAAEAPDAYDLYKKVQKKSDSAATMEIKTVSTSEVLVDGESVGKGKVVGLTKQKKSGDKLELSSVVTTEEGEDVTVYYKDGYLYQSAPNIPNTKTKLSIEDAMEQFDSLSDLSDLIVAENVKKGTVEALDDGNYKIRFSISGADMTALIDSAMSALDDSGDIASKIAMSAVNYTMTVTPDGDMVSYTTAFSMNISDTDASMTIKSVSKATVISMNESVTMNFPPNLDSYKLAA